MHILCGRPPGMLTLALGACWGDLIDAAEKYFVTKNLLFVPRFKDAALYQVQLCGQ